METRITCCFMEPSLYAEEGLRRFAFDTVCSAKPESGHNVYVKIGSKPFPLGLEGDMTGDFPKDDPLWPKVCDCGYVFLATDGWQHCLHRLYSRDDHFALTQTLRDAPVGAMWYANWYPWKGPDGQCLVVKTPGGDWIVDGPSFVNGEAKGLAWNRTGAPPQITATPSIHFVGKYHGFLTDGILISC